MSIIKTKYRNCMDIRSPLHVALSTVEPRFDLLVNNKQAGILY